MEAWPSTLPQIPLPNFSAKPVAGLASKDEQINPGRTRTYPEESSEFRFRLTLAQLEAFNTFYDSTLNQCAPFSAPWLADLGYDFHYLRITEEPAWTPSGIRFELTLKAEIIAGVPTDDDGNPAIWLPEEEDD